MPTFGPLEPYPLPKTRDGSLQEIGVGRPGGRHASELSRAMAEASGSNMESIPGEQPWMRAQIGFLWERALHYVDFGMPWTEAIEVAWKELHWATRPVDLQLRLEWDGVKMTPDARSLERPELEEYKFTWKSMRKWLENPEKDFFEWMVRIPMYLYGWNQLHPEEPMYSCRFIVFWANGDYSRKLGQGPQPTQCVVTWTPEELEDNWSVAKTYDAWLTEQEAAAKAGQLQRSEPGNS